MEFQPAVDDHSYIAQQYRLRVKERDEFKNLFTGLQKLFNLDQEIILQSYRTINSLAERNLRIQEELDETRADLMKREAEVRSLQIQVSEFYDEIEKLRSALGPVGMEDKDMPEGLKSE